MRMLLLLRGWAVSARRAAAGTSTGSFCGRWVPGADAALLGGALTLDATGALARPWSGTTTVRGGGIYGCAGSGGFAARVWRLERTGCRTTPLVFLGMRRTGVVGTTIRVEAIIWGGIGRCRALYLGREVLVVRMRWGGAGLKWREELGGVKIISWRVGLTSAALLLLLLLLLYLLLLRIHHLLVCPLSKLSICLWVKIRV